jgi:hypothetical protein
LWEELFEPHQVEMLLDIAKSKPLLTFSNEDRKKFCREIRIRYPSTGIKAIWHLKKLKPELCLSDIYGFTLATEAERFNGHYFRNDDWRNTRHDFSKEAKIIMNIFAGKHHE